MSVPVTIAPTSTGEKPRLTRYWASRTLTKPSTKPRTARPVRMRGASFTSRLPTDQRMRIGERAWATYLAG